MHFTGESEFNCFFITRIVTQDNLSKLYGMQNLDFDVKFSIVQFYNIVSTNLIVGSGCNFIWGLKTYYFTLCYDWRSTRV